MHTETAEVRVHIGERVVRKRYPLAEKGEVSRKYALLAKAAAPNVLFVTPLRDDPGTTAIDFPWIEGLEPVPRILFPAAKEDRAEQAAVLQLAARALAAIHAVPAASVPHRWSHPQMRPDDGHGVPVLLHGDFGFSNLFVLRGARRQVDKLVVIDAEANGYFSSRHLEAGPRYVDLALMGSCLLGRLGPLRSLRADRVACVRHIEAFLRAYEEATSFGVQWDLFCAYTEACVRSYFDRKFGPGWLAAAASRILLNRGEP